MGDQRATAESLVAGVARELDGVPHGYKRTEVGVIPEDWDTFRVEQLFAFLRTASNPREDLGESGAIAYVHYGDLHTRFKHIIDFSRDHLPRLTNTQNVTATLLRNGDLIVADASEDEAGLGKSVGVRNIGPMAAISGLHTFLLRPRDRRVCHDYVGYLLENELVRQQIGRLATGLKVFGISKAALAKVLIPLPLLAEQRAIAEALSDLDGLLKSLDALIVKKRAIKWAAMQRLLTGKTRLPGFTQKWSTKRLGEVVSIRNEKILPCRSPPDTTCVELEHMASGEGRLLRATSSDETVSPKYRFFSGDVLFGRLRPYLRKFWLAKSDGICSTEIWPLVPSKGSMAPGFLLGVIQSECFISTANMSYGTHMPRADWAVMRELNRRVEGVVTEPPPSQSRACGLPHSVPLKAVSLRMRRSCAQPWLAVGDAGRAPPSCGPS